MGYFDFLVVGAGLSGATCARILTDVGAKVLVIEKSEKLGGLCRTETKKGIVIHEEGPHIFHTNSEIIWDFVNNFAEFNSFRYQALFATESDMSKLYSFPINLLTLNQLYGVQTYLESKAALLEKREDLIEKFFVGYSKKQWGRHFEEIFDKVRKRIPMRAEYNPDYFTDKFQGVPVKGYSKMIQEMLSGVVVSHSDYFDKSGSFRKAKHTIFTGSIDEFFGYKYGKLNYRSLSFLKYYLNLRNYQGNSIINFGSEKVPYTRRIEHKHFQETKCSGTYISLEYPKEWKIGMTRHYPIETQRNLDLYKRYAEIPISNTTFLGRLGTYKYLNMDQVIEQAIDKVKTL